MGVMATVELLASSCWWYCVNACGAAGMGVKSWLVELLVGTYTIRFETTRAANTMPTMHNANCVTRLPHYATRSFLGFFAGGSSVYVSTHSTICLELFCKNWLLGALHPQRGQCLLQILS